MQKGFSLIEVMVVVAIFMLLVAIGMRNYQDYMLKTQVSRVVHETSQLKKVVELCLLNGQTYMQSQDASQHCETLPLPSSILVGESQNGQTIPVGMGVPQITNPLTKETSIESTFGNSANVLLHDKKILWQRTESGEWDCSTDIDIKYRSVACSNNLKK